MSARRPPAPASAAPAASDRAHESQASDPVAAPGLLALQRAAGNAAVTRLVESEGEPLAPDVRADAERRHGVDLGDVRVHTGDDAATAAAAFDAAAFTTGRDIVLGADVATPAAPASRAVLDHEVAHVVQQAGAPEGERPLLGHAGDAWEIAADGGPAVPAGAPPLVQRQDPRHLKGFMGEQTMGFVQYRWEDGWAVVRGPSGSSPLAHGVTTGGEDGLAYNVRSGILSIADNKSFARAGNVASATAIDPTRNLLQNLDDMVASVENMSTAQFPYRQEVLRLLRQTRAAVTNGEPIPGRVRLVVHGEVGASSGVTQRLQNLGIEFIGAPRPVVPTEARPVLGRPPVVGEGGQYEFEFMRNLPKSAPQTASAAAAESETAAAAESAQLELSLGKAAAAEAEAAEAGAAGAGASRFAGAARSIGAGLILAGVTLVLAWIGAKYDAERMRRQIAALGPEVEARVRAMAAEIEKRRAELKGTSGLWLWITFKIHSTSGMQGMEATPFHAFGVVYLDKVELMSGPYEGSYVAMGMPRMAGIDFATQDVFTYVTTSAPVPYDPADLTTEEIEARIRSNEEDARYANLNEGALRALWLERDSMLAELRQRKTAVVP